MLNKYFQETLKIHDERPVKGGNEIDKCRNNSEVNTRHAKVYKTKGE